MQHKVIPAAVFDLDGTIRYAKGKIFADEPSDWVLYEGVEEKLWEIRNSGYVIFGVSNQGGVAYGKKTEKQLAEEMSYFFGLFAKNPFHVAKTCMHMEGGRRS